MGRQIRILIADNHRLYLTTGLSNKEIATSFPISLEFRRCGLQFGELSKEQNRQMELYLNNYTEVME